MHLLFPKKSQNNVCVPTSFHFLFPAPREGRGGEGRGVFIFTSTPCFLLQGDPSEAVLWRFVDGGDDDEGEGVAGAGKLVEYYVKVMRLFEQASAPTLVVDIATVATGVACRDDPNCVSFLRVWLLYVREVRGFALLCKYDVITSHLTGITLS